MKIVEKAARPPGYCLASRDTEGPFIDTGLYARHRDPYIYLSVRWIEEQAQELGMVSAELVEALKVRLLEMEAEIGRLTQFIEAQKSFEDSAAELVGDADGGG